MKLDQITDIEILRNELKKHMIKCIKDFTYKRYDGKIVEFKAGEYYYIIQESDWDNYLYDCSQDTGANINTEDIFKYFEVKR